LTALQEQYPLNIWAKWKTSNTEHHITIQDKAAKQT